MISLAFLQSIKKHLERFLDASVSSRLASNDPRLDNLDTSFSSRLAFNDPRLNNLDASISSRLASDDPRLNNLDAPISGISPIKSIQRGTFTFSPGSSGTITLNTPVDPQKAVVLVSCKAGHSIRGNMNISVATLCEVHLTDATTLSWSASRPVYINSNNVSGTCAWQVVEFK